MVGKEGYLMAEGASLTRPPTFLGENYSYLKDKIKMYMHIISYAHHN